MPNPNTLPNNDRPYVFKLLRQLICVELRAAADTLASGYTLALNKPLVKVHEYEQLPATEAEKLEAETVPDPVVGADDPLTSFVEIEFATVREDPYTSEANTALALDFSFNVVMSAARWDDPAFPYTSSAQLFEALFAVCGERLRGNRSFGYDNVTHFYLQQPFARTERDDESDEPLGHTAQWLLPVVVEGARA